MRLRVCPGIMLLGLCSCQSLPSIVRIEVDGSTVEFKKKPAQPAPDQPDQPSVEAPEQPPEPALEPVPGADVEPL